MSNSSTALGVIDSDGVYGLQRKLKKDGAQSVFMSLGKVDDEATKILMVKFYMNLMGGRSKYDEPEYWASSIMFNGFS